jgi:crotonobetainyl-CoA:carnitine CoA-transferase CaiB-like acyl-CoA transferase
MAPRNLYRASDGHWVALTAGTNALVARLFGVIGRPELAHDERFRTNRDRLANVEELDALVARWVGGRPAARAVEALVAARVSAAVVDDVPAVLGNPHFRARGEVVTVHDPALGPVTTAAPWLPPHGTIRRLGGELGADNDAVFVDWLGLGRAELERLRAAGIV